LETQIADLKALQDKVPLKTIAAVDSQIEYVLERRKEGKDFSQTL